MENTNTEHKKNLPKEINLAIVTISDSRKIENDSSGKLIKEFINKEGYNIISYSIIPDKKETIKNKLLKLISENIDVIITTGGTGLTSRDVTIETIKPLFEKEINAFSTLFQKLSFEAIGSASFLSRATAGIIKKKLIFCLPGSPNAVRLAMKKLIIPEIAHIIKHIRE